MDEKDKNDKPARIPRPTEEALRDQIEAMVRAILVGAAGLIPQPFGLIIAAAAGYLAPLFPTHAQRRTQKWLANVAQGLNTLRLRGVDVDGLVENEEFTDFLIATTEFAMRTHSDEKRERLRNVLVNAALPGATESRVRLFARLVDQLDEIHMSLLRFGADPHAFLAKLGHHPVTVGRGLVVYEALADLLTRAFRLFADQDLFELAVDELGRLRLTKFQMGVECRPGQHVLTELGEEFLRFISEPPAPAPQA